MSIAVARLLHGGTAPSLVYQHGCVFLPAGPSWLQTGVAARLPSLYRLYVCISLTNQRESLRQALQVKWVGWMITGFDCWLANSRVCCSRGFALAAKLYSCLWLPPFLWMLSQQSAFSRSKCDVDISGHFGSRECGHLRKLEHDHFQPLDGRGVEVRLHLDW